MTGTVSITGRESERGSDKEEHKYQGGESAWLHFKWQPTSLGKLYIYLQTEQ